MPLHPASYWYWLTRLDVTFLFPTPPMPLSPRWLQSTLGYRRVDSEEGSLLFAPVCG
jgi:hypothetical protein